MATRPLTRSAVSLVEAAEDPRLFGLELSERQRELLRLMDENSLVVCAAGRQSGKSLLAAVALVHNLLLRVDLDEIAGRSPRYALLRRQLPEPGDDHARLRTWLRGEITAVTWPARDCPRGQVAVLGREDPARAAV